MTETSVYWEKFEFNSSTSFVKLWDSYIELDIQPEQGFKLILPKGIVDDFIQTVPDATFARLQVMVFHYDLDKGGNYEVIRVKDFIIPLFCPVFPKTTVSIPLNHQGEKALVVAAGIQFIIREECTWNKRYYACKITDALHLVYGAEVFYVKPPRKVVDEPENESLWDWEVEEE